MTNSQAVETNQEYRNIPITVLVESPTNPRKRFDERTLAELAASFKTQGILEPFLKLTNCGIKMSHILSGHSLKFTGELFLLGIGADSERQF